MASKTVKVQAASKDKLSSAQKRFNLLIKQIDKQKAELTAWTEFKASFVVKYNEVQPVMDQLHELQAQAVRQLDQLHDTRKLSNKQRENLSSIIQHLCEMLINEGYDELKALYDKHSAGNYDDELAHDKAEAAEMLEQMFRDEMGMDIKVDPSQIDPKDPMQTLRNLMGQMQEQHEQQAERASTRKKSAKQLAKEAKQQEEEASIAKSLQSVYRQLVSQLHPDREPDPAERERKTALMQQVTVAYEKQDLLKLFELQLSIEQIDQQHLNNIAEDKLKHYNKVLQGQLDEIKIEIEMIQTRYRVELDTPPFIPVSRKEILAELEEKKLDALDTMENMRHDLENFADNKYLKEWIREMAYQRRQPDFFDFL